MLCCLGRSPLQNTIRLLGFLLLHKTNLVQQLPLNLSLFLPDADRRIQKWDVRRGPPRQDRGPTHAEAASTTNPPASAPTPARCDAMNPTHACDSQSSAGLPGQRIWTNVASPRREPGAVAGIRMKGSATIRFGRRWDCDHSLWAIAFGSYRSELKFLKEDLASLTDGGREPAKVLIVRRCHRPPQAADYARNQNLQVALSSDRQIQIQKILIPSSTSDIPRRPTDRLTDTVRAETVELSKDFRRSKRTLFHE